MFNVDVMGCQLGGRKTSHPTEHLAPCAHDLLRSILTDAAGGLALDKEANAARPEGEKGFFKTQLH